MYVWASYQGYSKNNNRMGRTLLNVDGTTTLAFGHPTLKTTIKKMYYQGRGHDCSIQASSSIQVGHKGDVEKAFHLCPLWILWVGSQYQPYNENIGHADVQ